MALKFQRGKAVAATSAKKSARDAQLHKLMDELQMARDRVFKESQKLTDFGVPNNVWNAHVSTMREFYSGVDAVYNDAARMLHVQDVETD